MPTKITITLKPTFATDFTRDLIKFKELPPEDKKQITDDVVSMIVALRDSEEPKIRNIRKTLAIGAAVLMHVDTLEITEHE